MLRFNSQATGSTTNSSASRGSAKRLRWRVWLLIIALGLVISTMNQLNKPEVAERLGEIFGSVEQSAPQQSPEQQVLITSSNSEVTMPKLPESPQTELSLAKESGAESTEEMLEKVRDNTYFRPDESEAWFSLLEQLQGMSPQQLADASLGELTYAQLLKQPDVYRGNVVTLRGIVRREEEAELSGSDSSITSYHRLTIQPRGGGQWPFVVYCLTLPEKFPKGENLQQTISVNGYFFKNWSYAWQDGLGIAPVVLARGIDWHPAPLRARSSTFVSVGWIPAIIVASLCALLVTWFVLHNTRRPPIISRETASSITLPEDLAAETVDEQLHRLANSGEET